MRKDASTVKQLRERDVVHMMSDKSKRLVALPSNNYLSMFEEHKKNLTETRPVLPSTNQATFNKRLSRIANKYQDPVKKMLLDCSTCEPIPSVMRCLPKDYKQGEVRGRPIDRCMC